MCSSDLKDGVIDRLEQKPGRQQGHQEPCGDAVEGLAPEAAQKAADQPHRQAEQGQKQQPSAPKAVYTERTVDKLHPQNCQWKKADGMAKERGPGFFAHGEVLPF